MVQYSLSLCSRDAESGTSSNFVTKFQQPLKFPVVDKSTWEVGLISAYLPNTYYNISATNGNNKFYYYNGTSNQVLTIPDGSWAIADLNSFIQSSEGINNTNISITADSARQRAYIVLANGYTVDFTQADTFRDLIGFPSAVVSTQTTRQYGTSGGDMNNGNSSFHILCDLVDSSFSRLGSRQSNVLFSFNFSVGASGAENIVPAEHVHLPCSRSYCDSIRITIVNQNGDVVDLNNELVVVNLKVKQVTPLNNAMF